ncbi:VOC family protein [Alkalicoccus urumqiensis]|uniref:PhnB-like domain-containing protein n=1 Tax=Alkalicoccus urumqiensis TaxID=1548213 RepID=A0A2P6MLT4_ALKUR|nr:VOC family protein [Alkalicoccus urumqiensis]PRO67254.1 hypothetical protein C6I21_01445 [Alkalicoccus urumqiensis]
MPVQPYLNFPGTCEEAVRFYQSVFSTEAPETMRFSDMPADPEYPLPEEAADRILHTRLTIAGTTVMFSDTFPGMEHTVGTNVTLAVLTDSRENVKQWFHALAENGTVGMELQETFWSPLYGTVTDRFGISWQFNLESD